MIGGVDPYEVPGNEWTDDVDLWPAIAYIATRGNVSSANSQSVYIPRRYLVYSTCAKNIRACVA